MTRLSYTKALDNVLLPLGFTREKSWWSRVSGEILEQLDLQKSWIDGSVTVNLWAKNVETERIIKTIPSEIALGIVQFGLRIARVVDGPMSLDRWWKNDPGGPMEVAGLVKEHAVPWFSRVTSLEDQARHWYGRGTTGTWKKSNLAALVVTLYRLGELDEALALFDEPIPRTANPRTIEKYRRLQRWVEDQIRQRAVSAQAP